MTVSLSYRAYMRTIHPPVDSQTIVVGTDGSSDADLALEWAINEAGQTGRRVVVVHAAPLASSVVFAALTPLGFPDATTFGTEVLRSAARRCRQAGVAVATTLAEGPAADCLIEASAGAAMLVLGTRGRGQTASMLLGSVSHNCAHRAKCPVVLVKLPLVPDPVRPQYEGQPVAADPVR